AACCPPVSATPNHGIFAVHRDDLGTVRKIPAGELTTEHYLVVPKRHASSAAIGISSHEWLGKPRRMPTEELAEMLVRDGTSAQPGAALGYHPAYVRKLRGQLARGALADTEQPREMSVIVEEGYLRFRGEKGRGVPTTLPLTSDLAWLLGIFCAEGCITRSPARPNSYKLSFCFGPHEQELIERTARLLTEIFHACPAIVPRRTTTTVEVGQTSIARLFEALCGRGAKDKQVPPPVTAAPDPVIRAFLEGYIAGDGHRTPTHAVGLTVSERLALGLFELGLQLGLLPTFFSHTPPAWHETGTSFLVPLRHIERVPYSGHVYNLEVEDPDHSYVAPFLAVANCQNWDISKSRDMDRLMDQASPEAIADAAAESGCRSVAYTYNDPVIFAEYAIDTARACREAGVQNVAVTAGYISPGAREEFYA